MKSSVTGYRTAYGDWGLCDVIRTGGVAAWNEAGGRGPGGEGKWVVLRCKLLAHF
jgi:hypothetical protein